VVKYHTLLHRILAGGADLQIVRERLGHAQIATTQQYLGTHPGAGDRALAALRKTGTELNSGTVCLRDKERPVADPAD
jgi:hypothetical protein